MSFAFSDHFAHIIKLQLPASMNKLSCPKSKPLFKSKPNVIKDDIFILRLKEHFILWSNVKEAGLDSLTWWEEVVKPGIKKLLIQRGQELNKERSGILNLLQIRQSYLVKKLHSGLSQHLADLKLV